MGVAYHWQTTLFMFYGSYVAVPDLRLIIFIYGFPFESVPMSISKSYPFVTLMTNARPSVATAMITAISIPVIVAIGTAAAIPRGPAKTTPARAVPKAAIAALEYVLILYA